MHGTVAQHIICDSSGALSTGLAGQTMRMQGITPATRRGRDGAQSGSRAVAQRLAVPGPARSGCGAQPCEAHITSCQSLLVPRRRVWRAGPSACAKATCSEQYALGISAKPPSASQQPSRCLRHCIPELSPSSFLPSNSPPCSIGCAASGIRLLGQAPALQQV